MVDFAARVLRPAPGTVRATIALPHCTAQLVRAAGVLPADGRRSVVLYMHGGAFLDLWGQHSWPVGDRAVRAPTARCSSSTTG